jgi:hypothetical protein
MRVIRVLFNLIQFGVFYLITSDARAQDTSTAYKDTLGLPNISLISSGYETFATVWRPIGDSILLFTTDNLNEIASLGEDTTGLRMIKTIDMRFEDSLVEHVDYLQNVFFDFDNGIITYIAEDKHVVDTIIQLYPDPLNLESKKYVVWSYNNDRSTIYNLDFQNKHVSCDWYFEELDNIGTFRFVNSQFIEY